MEILEIFTKAIAGALGKVLEYWLIRPTSLFNIQRSQVTPSQREAAKIVRAVRIQPAQAWHSKKRAILDVSREVELYLRKSTDGSQRRFAVNFFEQYTDDMTIAEFLAALNSLPPPLLFSVTQSLVRELVENPSAEFLSSRDILSGVQDLATELCVEAFRDKKRLVAHHGQEPSPHYNKYQSVAWRGLDPPVQTNATEWRRIRTAQETMKRLGPLVIRAGCSPTHVVMSVAVGNWSDPDQQRLMVITATNTDKRALLVPSETPVVTKEGPNWYYYGEQLRLPSTELRSHWEMHERLLTTPESAGRGGHILHAHLIPFLKISRQLKENSSIQIGKVQVPHLDWFASGTSELGSRLSSGIIQSGGMCAILKDHGPWFVGSSLDEAWLYAEQLIHAMPLAGTNQPQTM